MKYAKCKCAVNEFQAVFERFKRKRRREKKKSVKRLQREREKGGGTIFVSGVV